MHLKGTDLYFKRLSVRSDQCGVQRLIHIGLWHGNVIFKSAWNGLVHLMDHAKCCITVLHSIYQDSYRKQVINLINSLILIDHLLINTEEMLHTAIYLSFDICLYHMLFYGLYNISYKFLPNAFTESYLFYQIIVYIRLQIFQGKVIKLHFDLGNTKTLCNRSINIHGLPCLFFLLGGSHILKGTHIMKTVSQFDQNYTDILCHSKKHLPQAFCLHFYFVLRIGQLTDLGHTIYQKGNLRTKFFFNFLTGHPGIFYRIMKQTGNNGLLVKFQICQDNCDT